MSRRRVFASFAAISMATIACASSGAPSSSWFDQSDSPVSGPYASAGNDEGAVTQAGNAPATSGPRVSVYANVSTQAGARHVSASFHLDDDAYVLVGHIDADGVLRIEFPENPTDNGFARGHASYETASFFGGFTSEMRARFSTDYGHLTGASRADSYDGGFSYIFVIASWKPMRFDQFSHNGAWDSYEVADQDYLRDPRPAVYELASLLAGTNPDEYTVKFARGFDTYSSGTYLSDSYGSSAFGASLCQGFGYGFDYGFGLSPFNFSAFNPLFVYGYGVPFFYRGTQYNYDPAGDCYYRNSYLPYGGYYYRPYGGYYFGGIIAQAPTTPPNGRVIGINQINRKPVSPQTAPLHFAPGGATDAGTASTSHVTLAPETASPRYRSRGLVAHQDPVGAPDVIAPTPVNYGSRVREGSAGTPANLPMVFRGGNSDNGTGRSQTNHDDASGRRAPNANIPRVDTPHAAPQAHVEAPRSAPQAHVEAPRSAPPAHVDAPRAEPARAAPAASAPRAEAPRSAPASSSSSSSGGKPPHRGH